MPVFVLRYGDFLHTKAIVRSVNFDISEATFDFNPEGMGAIPLMCNVTMDLTLLGGQSLAGPIDRIQTANDSNFIANSTFNSGRYKGNNRFKSSRGQEILQYGDKASGQDTTERTPIGSLDSNDAVEQPIEVTPLEERGTSQPFVDPRTIPQPYDNMSLVDLLGRAAQGDDELYNKYQADKKKIIIIDKQAREAQKQAEREAQEARVNASSATA